MPHRDFSAARRERRREPITFTLHEGERPFTCVDEVPGWVLLDLAAAEEEGRPVSGLREFFRQVLVDADYDRFLASVSRRTSGTVVTSEVLTELMEWLVETYTGRPTQQHSDSPDGPSSAGRVSKVVSLSKGTSHVA